MEDTIIKALLLGYAHIECNGTPIRICLKKAQGLLFYLLVHKKATRDELTGLLWGGEDNELARRHLRDNLYHLKKVVPIELVVPAGRSAIQLNPELGFYIDVDEFLKAVDVEAYQGEFLKGFSVPNCYEYEEWLERTRTSLREAYLQQLDKRAEFCLSEGKDGEAEALWRKYLQEEPLCETVSISLMRFYRAQKDYNRAALIYRGLHKAMADTLGIAPLKDTSELYYSIMKEWNEQSENGEISDDFLVGRQNQLQYLLHLFSRMHTSKHARSFVILGEAGVGKTHLLSYFLSHGEVSSYRLSGLSFEGRQVLNLVAMFPDYAPYRVLEVVSSKPTLDLLYVCQELCRRAILNEVYDGGSLSLVFTQAEFRDLTYSHIPALSRRILHLNIAQALSALDSAAMPNLDTLTAYHYEQGGDAFHAFQYKVRRFRTYVFFNYALLNGMPSSSESLLDSTPEALESFQKMKKELCHLQRLHPEDSALKAAETDLYYSIGCFCIYRGLYEQGVSAIRKLLQNPALSEEARDLAHEQMIFYGIQTYQTNVMRENIDAALSLTKGKNAARYAINRRYNGYLLVMEGRYEDAREELLRTLVLLHDSAEDEVERRLQSAYAHDYIGEAYRKQGMYARAIEEYQIAIDMIGEYADKQELEEAIIRRHYASSIEDEENQVDQGAAAAGGLSQGMRPEANRRKPALRP